MPSSTRYSARVQSFGAIAVIVMLAGAQPGQAAPALSPVAPSAPGGLLQVMMDDMGKGGAGGGMSGMSGPSGQPATPGMGGMGSMQGMGMGMMGRAPGAGTGMAMPSALPGFPGASHLYHVGATDFFLDHAEPLRLNVEQRAALNGIKQKSAIAHAGAQRGIDDAEQALWLLTAADQPDVKVVEGKLQEIEALRSGQRLALIRAVGEAARQLTPEQRTQVLGLAPMVKH